MSFLQNLDRAAATATCSFLANGGTAAIAPTLLAGAFVPATAVPSLVGALGLLALNAGCAFDPGQSVNPGFQWKGCRKVSAGGSLRFSHRSSAGAERWFSSEISEFTNIGIGYSTVNSPTIPRYSISGIKNVGGAFTDTLGPTINGGDYFVIVIERGTCVEYHDNTGPVGLPPVTHTDTECNIKVEHLAWNVLPDGRVAPVYKMSPPATAMARASGGVISGCNFEPVIYVGPPGGGGGGGTVIPWVPGPDLPGGLPWWTDLIDNALGLAAEQLLEKLLETKFQPDTYRLVSVCETDAQGEPISQSREVEIPALSSFEAVVARVDALTELIQGLKDFKQPICRTRPQLTGEWVTVNFISDEPSPAGERPLRKLFRYRDQTSASQDDHVAHWENFTWQAGPVMVVHRGASWGTPKVWAQTPAEGKRVIRHAAAIAGVDTEAPGTSWIVSGASDPRYGQTGTMRVSHKGGVFHVSKRPTPDGLPQMAKVFLDS